MLAFKIRFAIITTSKRNNELEIEMNIATKLNNKFPELKGFKVSQAWVEFGELYMISDFDIPNDLFDECEEYAVNEM